MQTQNFRNGSKSALRKSEIYIYEQFLDKIFEIPQNLYMNIYTRELGLVMQQNLYIAYISI